MAEALPMCILYFRLTIANSFDGLHFDSGASDAMRGRPKIVQFMHACFRFLLFCDHMMAINGFWLSYTIVGQIHCNANLQIVAASLRAFIRKYCLELLFVRPI